VLVLVDKVNDESEVRFDIGYCAFDKGCEEINRSSVNTCALVIGRMKDSLANVTRQRVRLGWYYCGGWWVMLGGNWLCVELVDMGDVVGTYSGNGLG
jgi:hypothetical protein